jgi:GNAT superfamily N-acetyltransferase
MAILVDAEGPILERILDDTYSTWHDGLTRPAYGRFYAAQVATPWGRAHLRRLALVEGDEVLSSAKLYAFDAVLDGRLIKVAGIGAVFTPPTSRGRGAARELIERLLERAAADEADLALLFSEIGPDYYVRLGFTSIAPTDRQLRVTESTRYGAPATMVRGGDDRDLAAIVSMGRARVTASAGIAPFRFHLDRDRDLVHFAIARKRLRAGLGPSGARAVHFFIAEEGASAAAYVVISVRGNKWTLEEAGDRDPSGARLGAILQVLIARDPAEKRPSIKAWLPDGFLPPQITVIGEQPSAEVMMIRALTPAGVSVRALRAEELVYWHGDVF